VDMCTLLADEKSYNGHTVTLKGSIVSDAIERTELVDPKCRGEGVTLVVTTEAAKKADVRRLEDAIYRNGLPGTIDKDISAVVEGTFHIREDSPYRTLLVSAVSDVHIRKKKGWQ
jgi:hypothetical protein